MTETNTKTPRRVKVLLAVSLGLNLLVVGAVVGTALTGGSKGGPQRFDLTAGPLTRAMDDDRRDSLRARLSEADVFRRGDRADIRADMNRLVEALRAPDFDAQAFVDALTRQRDRLRAGQDAAVTAIVEEIETMSQDERNAFADRLVEQMRRRPGG